MQAHGLLMIEHLLSNVCLIRNGDSSALSDILEKFSKLVEFYQKHIATNKKQETNVPGLHAVGDICVPPCQVAKAFGEGCVAGMEVAAYAKMLQKRQTDDT